MPYPLATVTFGGIPVNDIRGCNYTLSHGIQPGVAALQTVPLTRDPGEFGTLTFEMAGRRVSFQNCRIEDVVLPNTTGVDYWTLRITDRRWAWKYGEVSGHYNRRLANGAIDPKWERTPQQLAAILLNAEGERGFDVAQLPNVTRPEFRWESSNPMQELARLCDQLSCRIVLGLDSRVRIWRIGQGNLLPVGGKFITSVGEGLKKTARPSSIKVVGGPVLFQSKLKLRAVGEDTNGAIKPVAQLSYTPTSLDGWRGWELEDIAFPNVTRTYQRDGKQLEAKDLAKRTVWRWYQIYEQVHGGLSPPGWQLPPVVRKEQLWGGIRNDLLEFFADFQDVPRPIPAYVEGVFSGGGVDHTNAVTGTLAPGDFSIDSERGLVMFADPVFKRGVVNHAGVKYSEAFFPADLYLVTSYSCKKTDDDMPALTSLERRFDQRVLSGPDIIRAPEIQERFIGQGANGNNIIEFPRQGFARDEMNALINNREQAYRLEPSADIQYDGIEPVSPDGAIQQVTWTKAAGQNATTRASRNREHRLDLASHQFKRKQDEELRLLDLAKQKRLDMLDAHAGGFSV